MLKSIPVVLCSLVAARLSIGAAEVTPSFHRESLTVPERQKFTVTQEAYAGLVSPNPRGWYYKCANVVLAQNGTLVGSWQISDSHTSVMTYIMVARSTDGGRTWGDYQTIAQSSVWDKEGCWVVPQMSVLRDGRIVIISDWGQRRSGQNWPMLAHWQKEDRGMSNHIFWSSDHGKTWTGAEKIDEVGGEPGYIEEFSDSTLAFTRTSSATTDLLKNPPMPWGNIYYRNEIVFSRDGGRTWGESAWVSDSPFHGDCEVGLAEIAPGKLIAASRIGLGNGRFGHPSRLLFSDDNGRTWDRAVPAPFYGQRVHLGKLRSGKFLATYRNVWGTPGTRALVFSPEADAGFQPTSYITEEERCELTPEMLTVRTAAGERGAVEFSLYPAQDDQSRVEISATLRVRNAEENGVTISAGCWVHFSPNRIYLGDRPDTGFDFDTRGWHDYRILREKGTIRIFADGKQMLSAPIDDIWGREVRFGNRAKAQGRNRYSRNESVSDWRSVTVKVDNAVDYSIDWRWTPTQGYPDQFRRDRTVVLDSHPDCGYSSWTQLPDDKIVIVNYTAEDRADIGTTHLIRSYVTTEQDLSR